MKILLSMLIAGLVLQAAAQNPIAPKGVYIADPEAHVWPDGTLYIYGSRDESDDHWCSYRHHVLSTRDMINWRMDENSFASTGPDDRVDYSDKLLFAPDCAYRDGTYYLYFCSPGKPFTEGVATSTSPYGPFENAVEIKGATQIDPAVLIDNDGQGYHYWGQHRSLGAKLKPNLREIDLSTKRAVLNALGEAAFHEGSSIRKINGKYYLVFADESRAGRPTCLGYAIGDSPLGPFVYQGIIIDNAGSDPAVWNNHGSIEPFNGQWYVFYHRSTHNSQKMRKVCVEPITIHADGTIDEVEMTSQGAGPPLNAFDRIDAERACLLSGNVRIAGLPTTDLPEEGLTQIKSGDQAVFKYIDFGDGANRVEIKTTGISAGGAIEIVLDQPDAKPVGRCRIAADDNTHNYRVDSCTIEKVTGVHAVYLKFGGGTDALFNVDWMVFY